MDIKQYHRVIIDDISLIGGVSTRAMMGGYVVYYKGKVVGGLYESGFLIKNIDAVKPHFKNILYEIPYENGKPMIKIPDGYELSWLEDVFKEMYDYLPFPKSKQKTGG